MLKTTLLFLLLLLTVSLFAQPASMNLRVERESSATTPAAATQESTDMLLIAPIPPAEIVPAEIVPAEIVPAEIVPAEIVPAEIVPAEIVPAEIVPAEIVPAEIVPAEIVPAEIVPAEIVPAEIVPAADTLSDLERQMLMNSFRTLSLIPGTTINDIAIKDLTPEDLKIVHAGKNVTVFLPQYSILGFNLGDFVIRYAVVDDKNIELSWLMPKTFSINDILLIADKVTAVGTWNADFGAFTNFYFQINGFQMMNGNVLVAEIAEINFNAEASALGDGTFDVRNQFTLMNLQVPGRFQLGDATYFEAATAGPNSYQILDAYDAMYKLIASEERGEALSMLDVSAMLSQFAALLPKTYEAGLRLNHISIMPVMFPEIQLANFTLFSNAKNLDAKSHFDFGYEVSGLTLPVGLVPDNFLPFLPEQGRLTFRLENFSIKPLLLLAANALSRELNDEDMSAGLMMMRLIYKVFADELALSTEAEILAKEFSSTSQVRLALNGTAFYLTTGEAQLTIRGMQALAAQLPAQVQAELIGPMMMLTMLAKEIEKDTYQLQFALTADGAVLLNGEEQAEMGKALKELVQEIMDEINF